MVSGDTKLLILLNVAPTSRALKFVVCQRVSLFAKHVLKGGPGTCFLRKFLNFAFLESPETDKFIKTRDQT